VLLQDEYIQGITTSMGITKQQEKVFIRKAHCRVRNDDNRGSVAKKTKRRSDKLTDKIYDNYKQGVRPICQAR